jgi:hypothetical protein
MHTIEIRAPHRQAINKENLLYFLNLDAVIKINTQLKNAFIKQPHADERLNQ